MFEGLLMLCCPHLLPVLKEAVLYWIVIAFVKSWKRVGELTGISLESELVMTVWHSGAVQPEILWRGNLVEPASRKCVT